MKKLLLLFFLLISSSLFAQENDTLISSLQVLQDEAKQVLGVPYRYGGTNHSGFDCSGLVCHLFKQINIQLPHQSTAIAQYGEPIIADSLQIGDLIFFEGYNKPFIGHVAMVSKVEAGLIYIIHATSSRGVIEEVLQHNNYFLERWIFNRRIL